MSEPHEPTPPSSKNADGIYEPFDASVVPFEHWSKGERYEMRWQRLSGYGGGTQIGVLIETPVSYPSNTSHCDGPRWG